MSKVKDAIETLFNEINYMGNGDRIIKDIQEAIQPQHRTLKQGFMRDVIVPIINQFAKDYDNGYYDLRNESTVKVCKKLSETLEQEHFPFI